jgi:xylan 1,4-beta-xylosidase
MQSRREALKLGTAMMALGGGSASIATGTTPPTHNPATDIKPATGIEGQRKADLGNGTYLNPVLSGDRPDPNVFRDGEDYYATFSSFLYYPAVVVWHSRDLINWRPIGPALNKPLGSVWALDIAKHGGRYFIYIPIFNPGAPGFPADLLPARLFVVHADSMAGPWSEPVDMGIAGYIDPGHAVGEDGRRYLFLNNGARVRLTDDGLKADGPVEKVYDGWPIPDDWVIEAPALEGPKVLRRGAWFYLFSGQGGTAGPPTSHMVIVARSRSINGPWENCPHNPIVHTASAAEPWWSRGHATAVQGPAGDWWLAYHAYENGYRTLGRQMLLEPFAWGADGWPHALGGDLSHPLKAPRGGRDVGTGLALSGPFSPSMLGARMTFFDPRPGYLDRLRFDHGQMMLSAQGKGPADSSPLAMIAGDRSYEVEVDLEVFDEAEAGLLLWYDDRMFCGVGTDAHGLHGYQRGAPQGYPPVGSFAGRAVSLRLRNIGNVVTFSIRPAGGAWRKLISWEVSGYNHNMAGGFMSLRPALYCSGKGQARFAGLTYRALG